jgi:hypothetical protein
MKIKLPQLSAQILGQLLESTGWAKPPHATSDIIHAGEVLAQPGMDFKIPDELNKARTQSDARRTDAKWCDKPVELEISVKAHATCERAIRHGTENAILPGGRYTSALLSAFGFKTE